jgi:hypothetical protein
MTASRRKSTGGWPARWSSEQEKEGESEWKARRKSNRRKVSRSFRLVSRSCEQEKEEQAT